MNRTSNYREGTWKGSRALYFGAYSVLGIGVVYAFACTQVTALGATWSQLVICTAITLVLVLLGIARSVSVRGTWDLFHPLVFPTIYIAISFLLPIWVAFVSQHPVGPLTRDVTIATNTPALLCLGLLGFAAGAAIHLSAKASSTRQIPDPAAAARMVSHCGRALAVLALLGSAIQLRQGGVLVRGLDQTTYSSADTLNVLLTILPPTAVVLLCAGSALKTTHRVMPRADWILTSLLILSVGVRGTRNTAVAIALVALFFYVKRTRKPRLWTIAGTFGFALGFMLLVLQYRNSARGLRTPNSWWESVLGDMAPVGFSTGAVASHVPSQYPFAHGSTMIAAVVRQLPGPLSVRLFGPTDDTGSRVFREIISFHDANNGLGFSIPADGYLNFGVAGIVGFCFMLGLLFAWSYAHFDVSALSARALMYPLLCALLPFGLRSDLLGMTKGLLYPLITIFLVMALARSIAAKGTAKREVLRV